MKENKFEDEWVIYAVLNKCGIYENQEEYLGACYEGYTKAKK